MNSQLLSIIFSFFTDKTLDRHRLLQGNWPHYIGHYSDGDLNSDAPLHHFVYILNDQLNTVCLEELEATQVLTSLCYSAVHELTLDLFTHPKSPFWNSFFNIAAQSKKELNITAAQVDRKKIQQAIENYL